MIYCDGSSWNGKVSKICINKKGEEPLIKEFKSKLTNNEVKYLAVLDSIVVAEEGETIKTDSQLVIKQCFDEWKTKASNLKHLHEATLNGLDRKDINLEWIPKEKNKARKVLRG